MALFHAFQMQCKQLLPNTTDFLIGLSGGVDSVVLLHLFARTKQNIRAIYIHHGLSPNADSWADFCEQYCKRLNIPFILQKVVVDSREGIENGARTARYQAFRQHLQPNEVLATAHHLDDQAETFFLALKRGSGIKGLSAMQAVSFLQNFTLFRPLLTFSKAELLSYAQQHQLSWIEDESNADSRYDRNFLRNEILPTLNQRWNGFSQMVARSAQHCAEQQNLIEELLADELADRIGEKNQFSIAGFEQFSQAKQQQLLRLWLEKNGLMMPSQAQLQAVIFELIFAKSDKNPQLKLGDKIIRRYQQAIYITEEIPNIPAFEIQLAVETELELPYQLGNIIRYNHEIICKKDGKTDRLQLPIELADQRLMLRVGQKGKVKLYRKPHREEMKKIWQQYQIPVWERERTPLIFWQEELVACLPY
ncbi:tRNA lysidine(34) synthetase TilS [Mannheimia sp. AT1]|uniref:tRNA(Ile)-lysidine synthase n=1 Tax=Mannheimia cairinae TaxID=3025936 RepID=A0ABT5MVT3_9PAST|nr:tRNA lysidine(34) synthetase TilS [Mannheimia cairinae]MDD0825022.1 tRNA lysidine(34) synthetase TilS [Mannheimia cairinae]MDD0827260.1 tRNA lysidine(34) synthetase TilS [Mannheimia cairinae]